MDKETKNLIDFYDKRIKDLENKNKEKQDKLDEIENYIENNTTTIETTTYGDFFKNKRTYIYTLSEELKEILQIIKGEDK